MKTVFVVQSRPNQFNKPLVGVFSDRQKADTYISLQPENARPRLEVTEIPVDLGSVSLVEYRAPILLPEAQDVPVA